MKVSKENRGFAVKVQLKLFLALKHLDFLDHIKMFFFLLNYLWPDFDVALPRAYFEIR